MAVSATISFVSSNVIAGSPTVAIVTISNSGASAVNVTSISPRVTPQSAPFAFSATYGTGTTLQVGASGTLSLPVTYTFQAPQSGTFEGGVSGVYSVSCVVATDDGSNTTPVAQFVAVSGSAPQAVLSGGQLNFTNGYNAANYVVNL